MKVAIIGFGDRGMCYAHYFRDCGAELVAICDIRDTQLKNAGDAFNLSADQLFNNEEDFWSKGKLADLLVISTLDQLHHRHVMKAIELGYDILLEKPIASTIEQCRDIEKAAKEHGTKIYLCYVLRYTPFFMKLKEVIDSGVIGKVASINLTEGVGFWHQSHSYVRGNWRNSDETSPMIIAKCSHDMDILYWLMDKEPVAVSSMGNLMFFNEENAPEGAAKHCCDCKYFDTCPYCNYRFYSQCPTWLLKMGLCEWNEDPAYIKEVLKDKSNPFSRCVFYCDNNVVDHQVTNIEFEGGATAHLTMTAFAKVESRIIRVHGTLGEVYCILAENKLYLGKCGEDGTIEIPTEEVEGGHGGGDIMMIRNIVEAYAENRVIDKNGIEGAMCSHYMGFAAEESRLKGGEKVSLK